MVITLLTDFGQSEEWVGVLKGVITKIKSQACIIDVCHEIPDYDVRKGALTLAAALPFMPVCVHLAIVDPGVGTKRRPIIIVTGRGDILVGPDNGLLVPAATRLRGINEIFEITNDEYFLKPVAATFHGRDVFAPVAAHLSRGVEPVDFGPRIKRQSLVTPPWTLPKKTAHGMTVSVIDVDKFGSVRFNCDLQTWLQAVRPRGASITLETETGRETVPFATTFSDVGSGSSLLLIDSSGFLTLAVNQGSAVSKFGLSQDSSVNLTWSDR